MTEEIEDRNPEDERANQLDRVHAVGGELITPEGFVISDPDQGTRIVLLSLDFLGGMLNVWEPFAPDDFERGDNLQGFLRRYERWAESKVRSLHFIDPRFGYDHYMQRGVIPHVIEIGIGIQRREDTRAMLRRRSLPLDPHTGLPLVGRKLAA